MAPFALNSSSAYAPPPPSFRYPTNFSTRSITQERILNFQRFLDMPTKDSFIENHAAMLRALRSLFSKCSPEVAAAGLKALNYFERIYPLEKVGEDGVPKPCARTDGTLERCHPLTVAWWLAYAGAPADVVVACLYHDALEDGKISSLAQWSQEMGIKLDTAEGAFLQSAWKKIETLTRMPVFENGVNLNDELRVLLQSPADFENPRVKEIISSLGARQEDYVTRIYRSTGSNEVESEGVMTALIKVFDTLYNTRSLIYLDPTPSKDGRPKPDFSRFYNTLRKAFSHLEALKKLNHELARQILVAIDMALKRLALAGIGPGQVQTLYSDQHYHVCEQSRYQRRVEHIGYADCGLRSVCNPDKNTYARTAISKFGPEAREALSLVGTPEHPISHMEFEVPYYVRKEAWWNVFFNTFRPIDLDKLQKALNSAFPKNIKFTPHYSYLPGLLVENHIFRFEPPKMMGELAKKLAALSPHSPEFARRSLLSNMIDEYTRFDRQVRRGLRYIYKKVVRGPAIPHYFSVAMLLAHQQLNKIIGVQEPHKETELPKEQRN